MAWKELKQMQDGGAHQRPVTGIVPDRLLSQVCHPFLEGTTLSPFDLKHTVLRKQ